MKATPHTYHAIDLTPLREKLLQDPRISSACVHGSLMTDNFRPDSDIDLALILEPQSALTGMDELRLSAELSSMVSRNVHIGVMNPNSLIYAKEVIKKGKELFVRNRFQHDLFISTILSMYAELKERQQEIRDAYTAG